MVSCLVIISNCFYFQHFEPSPERLDAQIRALALNQDASLKSFLQQQQTLLETNRSIVEALKEIKGVVEQIKVDAIKEIKDAGEQIKVSREIFFLIYQNCMFIG